MTERKGTRRANTRRNSGAMWLAWLTALALATGCGADDKNDSDPLEDAGAAADGTGSDGMGSDGAGLDIGYDGGAPEDGGGHSGSGLEIAGVYAPDAAETEGLVWMGERVTGSSGGVAWLVRYDNDGNWAISRVPPAVAGSDYFVRMVWTEPEADGAFWYCVDVLGATSAAEAEAAPQSADASDLDGEGCGGGPWSRVVPATANPLVGAWASNFGGFDVVTPLHFDGLFIARFEGDAAPGGANAGWLVTRNPDDDPYNPGKYTKIVWTGDGDGFAYCMVDFGLDSADLAASSTATADDGDLDGKGCGGFPWTRVSPHSPIDVGGVFSTNFGSFEVIDTARWASADVVAFDNAARWAVTQNAWDAEYNPSAYNKLVWTAPDDEGGLHYCTVTFGQDSLALARDTTLTADDGDLDGAGCGGFPWTALTPVLTP